MAVIVLETEIGATPEQCFDPSLSVDLHARSMSHTGERAIAGITTGLMGLGDTVTWEAKHLGVRQRLTVRITEYERPHQFVDEQVRGAFKSMRHVHEFVPVAGGTLMKDNFRYMVPLGGLGMLVDKLFLEGYMRKLLSARNECLKRAAETAAH